MEEAKIKAFRLTVKDLETGETVKDDITPLVVFSYLLNENEKQTEFAQGICKKKGVEMTTLLNACNAIGGIKKHILDDIVERIGKSLRLPPLEGDDE